MSPSSTLTSPEIWANIDQRMRKGDEDRWLSSRYAPLAERRALIALYAFCWELARVRLVVSEPALGAIRFQWWRDAVDEIGQGKTVRAHDVAGAIADICADGRLEQASLQQLIDGYEDAFETGSREDEPEALLARTAAGIVEPDRPWNETLDHVARAFAALRRGDAAEAAPGSTRLTTDIRPATAHFRLRRLYMRTATPGPLFKRLCVLRGVLTGKV